MHWLQSWMSWTRVVTWCTVIHTSDAALAFYIILSCCIIMTPRFGYWYPQLPRRPGYVCSRSFLSLPRDSPGHRHSTPQHPRGCVCLHARLLRHREEVEGIPLGLSLWNLWTFWWVVNVTAMCLYNYLELYMSVYLDHLIVFCWLILSLSLSLSPYRSSSRLACIQGSLWPTCLWLSLWSDSWNDGLHLS